MGDADPTREAFDRATMEAREVGSGSVYPSDGPVRPDTDNRPINCAICGHTHAYNERCSHPDVLMKWPDLNFMELAERYELFSDKLVCSCPIDRPTDAAHVYRDPECERCKLLVEMQTELERRQRSGIVQSVACNRRALGLPDIDDPMGIKRDREREREILASIIDDEETLP